MPRMLLRLFYVSEIVGKPTDVEMQVLLGQAQIRNRRLDITGMLAKSDGHFCQVIEGLPAAVEQVMERVRRDTRHQNIRVLLEQSVEQRQFEGWAMGLVVRDDLASEMSKLHQYGGINGIPMNEVIGWFMKPAAK